MSAKDSPTKSIEPDQEPGAAHPRDTFQFFGHVEAENMLAEGLSGARMHHAWLLTGPKGVGKATLAYRFARAALGAARIGPRPLDVDPDHPTSRKVATLAHPDLLVMRRGLNAQGKLRSEIVVEEARALGGFLSLKPAEGGWRVAIIDAVDDMNRNAANAILKSLEEPPSRTVLLLVCHTPGAVLATIRSRCRRLSFRTLSDEDVTAALLAANIPKPEATLLEYAGGRPGRAIALAGGDLVELEQALSEALRQSRQRPLRQLMPLVFEKSGTQQHARLSLFFDVASRHARQAGASATPSSLVWAEIYSDLLALQRECDGLDMEATHTFARACAIIDRARAAWD